MRRPKFRLALCAAGLAAALAGGALALGNGDSLISLSYLTDTFLPSAQSQLEEMPLPRSRAEREREAGCTAPTFRAAPSLRETSSPCPPAPA